MMVHSSKYAIQRHSRRKFFQDISGTAGLIPSKDSCICTVSGGFRELVSIWLSAQMKKIADSISRLLLLSILGSEGTFQHDLFKRDEPDLAKDIDRVEPRGYGSLY
mmetsp:Transcript_2024/g.4425  ORF Transcript_2024/g.4425 Transcript_2024/m.4425 type:complete len:106 (-) Transcript_2024:261-578(-)